MARPLTPFKLSALGLQVRRGGRLLLDLPRFELPRGEVTALIGPNGAGKTTLILQLALLEHPDAGEVLFDGVPARNHELALRRRMAVVFQEPLLLDRTVAANVETGMRLRGVPGVERRMRRDRWLARFGVSALSQRAPRTLSGGEAQRVSLARAFALEPEVLLLDEPFSALDQPTREAITGDLASALAETGVTALVVTHDRDEAARLGQRVAVMIRGRVTQTGTPQDVFGAPADEDTAAFVGIETMVPARVIGREGDLVRLVAASHEIEGIAPGIFDRALICLRPEDVVLSGGGEDVDDSARNRLSGRVTRIVRSGADARVEIDCGFPLIARITRRSLDDLALEAGSSVVASFKATAVHLIPK
jgi:tungstate transport system ATP-binding protein